MLLIALINSLTRAGIGKAFRQGPNAMNCGEGYGTNFAPANRDEVNPKNKKVST
ncbi:MAG: hypothetical protein WBM93_02865 [Parasphingorhabdus sp.]